MIHQEDMGISDGIGFGGVKSRTSSSNRLTRKIDGEARSTAGHISHANRSTVLGNDAVADAQTETGSLSDRFGGVEGIEHPRGILNTGSIVGEFDDQPVVLHGCADPKITFTRAL